MTTQEFKALKPRKFQDSDRVTTPNYSQVMVVDGIDDFLTDVTGRTHYTLWSEDYLSGQRKVNNADPCAEDELTLYKPE